ncbi:hypothetical protein TRFO_31608 [Tritrichomonas foetus]|uniref:Uncharacterized protein n=1 Tax=Tritrichomonas foetus TaxID=1144522 RepID=A0A1J4JVG7_9EUKA|nr:hypothetical protein TRFO_31608 [Tritrichomonas foetus]|eukprot:OHT01518.1 hypothetical protein TRFO_31608 [Tritrichomonas foetus]
MNSIDFNILVDPFHKDFLFHVEDAPSLVEINDITKYFDIILQHFQRKRPIPINKGKAILVSIITIVQNFTYRSMFIDKGHLNNLPYGISDYSDLIFDLFHVLISQDPDFFDAKLTEKFAQQIDYSPSKALVLITMYGEHFGEMENPWDVLDLLFYQAAKFNTPETIINYISLLTYLCRKKEDYKIYRSIQCFDKIATLLSLKSIPALKAAYGALISISGINEKCKNQESIDRFPVQLIINHLQSQNEELIYVALQFLLIYEFVNEKLINQLLNLNDPKAILVLMKYCENPKNATFLVNSNVWLTLPIVRENSIDYLKLVYCILQHRNLRRKFSSSQNLSSFLASAASNADQNTLVFILGVMKMMILTPQIIAELGKKKFFINLYKSADKCNCELTDQVRYNVFEISSEYMFTKEMINVCKCAVTEIMEMESLSSEAFRLIIKLCKYPECINVIKNGGLLRFYSSQMKNPRKRKEAEQLFALIQDDEDEYLEEEDYISPDSYDSNYSD